MPMPDFAIAGWPLNTKHWRCTVKVHLAPNWIVYWDVRSVGDNALLHQDLRIAHDRGSLVQFRSCTTKNPLGARGHGTVSLWRISMRNYGFPVLAINLRGMRYTSDLAPPDRHFPTTNIGRAGDIKISASQQVYHTECMVFSKLQLCLEARLRDNCLMNGCLIETNTAGYNPCTFAVHARPFHTSVIGLPQPSSFHLSPLELPLDMRVKHHIHSGGQHSFKHHKHSGGRKCSDDRVASHHESHGTGGGHNGKGHQWFSTAASSLFSANSVAPSPSVSSPTQLPMPAVTASGSLIASSTASTQSSGPSATAQFDQLLPSALRTGVNHLPGWNFCLAQTTPTAGGRTRGRSLTIYLTAWRRRRGHSCAIRGSSPFRLRSDAAQAAPERNPDGTGIGCGFTATDEGEERNVDDAHSGACNTDGFFAAGAG
ncbi:hypothetical protein B0H17DRAFT_1132759 [Mycena rosella]|uniref:Uncharacterized protein n=1 Tax=Mycena rosella TaxID=1033263 RepID=A0AAD7DKL7_MYCRO|nr:hypothetical protein B0H17DRAFT_1132759 [Mycena rosella]